MEKNFYIVYSINEKTKEFTIIDHFETKPHAENRIDALVVKTIGEPELCFGISIVTHCFKG